MVTTLDEREFQTRLNRLDELLIETEQALDPAARMRLQEVVQAILELHGSGLQRLLEHITDAGEAGRRIRDACARDGIVAGLLLLHDLHPFDVETRVRQALDSVRPALRSHGGNVDLIEINDGMVRLRLQGSCHHCPSSAVTMQQTIEDAILGLAPEIHTVEVDGLHKSPMDLQADRTRMALPLV